MRVNKTIKNKKLIILIILLIFTVSSCRRKDNVEKKEGIAKALEGVSYNEMYAGVAVSEYGIFWTGNFNTHLRLIMKDTGEDIICCYIPGCQHEPASADNPDPTCRAALFSGTTTRVFYHDGYIYYLVSDGINAHNLYKMKIGGSGRQFIGSVPYSELSTPALACYGNFAYYFVIDNIYDETTGKRSKETFVIEVNLKNGDYRRITPEITSIIAGNKLLQVTEDYVWLTLGSTQGPKVLRYNRKTLEEETFIDSEDYYTHTFQRAYNGYYVYWNHFDKLLLKNTDTGEETLIVDAMGKYIMPYVSGNGIYYTVSETSDSLEITGAYFYDLLTNEVTDITEKSIEYEILSYDGYNNVFFCRKKSSFPQIAVDREEILGAK